MDFLNETGGVVLVLEDGSEKRVSMEANRSEELRFADQIEDFTAGVNRKYFRRM
ncbi:MAG: hypothetical protein LUD54_04730 [Oscillospiraceae bacterium]|nr:hypothetical protein [Oscillospiraceae bacterium]